MIVVNLPGIVRNAAYWRGHYYVGCWYKKAFKTTYDVSLCSVAPTTGKLSTLFNSNRCTYSLLKFFEKNGWLYARHHPRCIYKILDDTHCEFVGKFSSEYFATGTNSKHYKCYISDSENYVLIIPGVDTDNVETCAMRNFMRIFCPEVCKDFGVNGSNKKVIIYSKLSRKHAVFEFPEDLDTWCCGSLISTDEMTFCVITESNQEMFICDIPEI